MIISIAAQKGGVGKTSLAFNLSGVIAESSLRVLLCDIDPQHSLSSTLVNDPYLLEKTLKDLLTNPELVASKAICHTKFANIDILPCNLSLGLLELELLSNPQSQCLLSARLDKEIHNYSVILIDCPPNLGIFTRLALAASDCVLIPMECSSYAVKSTRYLIELTHKTQKQNNPSLKILGFVINKLHDRRTIEQDYREMIRQNFGERVFNTEIKDSSKYLEAVTLKIPINFYRPKSEQSETYRRLFKEIQNRIGKILNYNTDGDNDEQEKVS